MNGEVKFYMDEHIEDDIAEQLREYGIDILTTYEAGMASTSDEKQLQLATAQGRMIVTRDDDYLRLNKIWNGMGLPHGGIAYAHSGVSIGDVIHGLLEIHEQRSAEDMQNTVEWIKSRTPFT